MEPLPDDGLRSWTYDPNDAHQQALAHALLLNAGIERGPEHLLQWSYGGGSRTRTRASPTGLLFENLFHWYVRKPAITLNTPTHLKRERSNSGKGYEHAMELPTGQKFPFTDCPVNVKITSLNQSMETVTQVQGYFKHNLACEMAHRAYIPRARTNLLGKRKL